MKKIIGAFDAFRFSNSTKEYAISLAQALPAHFNAIFFEDPGYSLTGGRHLLADDNTEVKKNKREQQKESKALLAVFNDDCKTAGISYNIHRENNLAITELLQESIYADLLVVAVNETFYYRLERQPVKFIRQLFAEVQCPVLLVPEEYKPVEKVIFLYDGEPLSVYAVKMYTYLFDRYKDLQPEVVTVRNDTDGIYAPHHRLMKDFVNRHYPEATYTILKGVPEEAITAYLRKQNQHAMVVLGASQKNTVVSTFREDMADKLMREIKMPLYVVHSK